MKGPTPNRWKQICGNLALKINGKLGGKNCALAERELNFGTNRPVRNFTDSIKFRRVIRNSAYIQYIYNIPIFSIWYLVRMFSIRVEKKKVDRV